MSDIDVDSTTGTFLDPRIKEELERLNTASAEINRLEKQLDESRQQFRQTLTESTHSLNEKIKKCRKSAAKSQSYYVAREEARNAQESAQEAALRYKRAAGMFTAAKETIAIAEEAAISTKKQEEKKRQFDSALQEMLNISTIKLNAAEKEKRDSQREHEERSQRYIAAQQTVDQLAKKFKRSIAKSASYYEMKKAFFLELSDLKIRIEALQSALQESKGKYRSALKSLERISEDIHQSRQMEAILTESRQSGVGADSNTDTESDPEHLEISFHLEDTYDGDVLSTDQESVLSDMASMSSPTSTTPSTSFPFRHPNDTPRSISEASLPYSDIVPTTGRFSVDGASSVSTEADDTEIVQNSTSRKMRDDENNDDDDDDDDIFLGVDSDDDLEDSDDEAVKAKQEENRKLRTISIGDLKSFNVNDNDDDSDVEANNAGEDNVGKTSEANKTDLSNVKESHSYDRGNVLTQSDDTLGGGLNNAEAATEGATPTQLNTCTRKELATEQTTGEEDIWI